MDSLHHLTCPYLPESLAVVSPPCEVPTLRRFSWTERRGWGDGDATWSKKGCHGPLRLVVPGSFCHGQTMSNWSVNNCCIQNDLLVIIRVVIKVMIRMMIFSFCILIWTDWVWGCCSMCIGQSCCRCHGCFAVGVQFWLHGDLIHWSHAGAGTCGTWQLPVLQYIVLSYGGFHSHRGTPIAGWFMRENSINMDDSGVPPFMETPISKQLTLCRFPWDHLQPYWDD